MRALIHIVPFIGLLLAHDPAFSQVWSASTSKEMLERIDANGRKFSELTAYELTVDMASYRSVNDAEPFDEGRSVMVRQGDNYRVDALGVTTVQDGKFMVSVDSSEQLMVFAKAGPVINQVGAEHMRVVVEKAKAVSKRAASDGVVYRIEFLPGAHYSRMEITYDSEGWMTRMESHWGFAIQEDPDDPRSPSYTPKVVMRFSKPVRLDMANAKQRLDLSRFVVLKNDRPAPAAAWLGYRVHDSRVQ